MSRLVVDVALIENVRPHLNAERLEIADVKGWQVVIPKGQYLGGERVVYFPPDTMIPRELAERFGVVNYLSFGAGSDMGRIRCARLRQEPSFGLVVFPDDPAWEIGRDVAEHYGALKYEPPFRASAGDAVADDPLFPTYTDIENLRNFNGIFVEGERVIVSEKIHGTNARVGFVIDERGEMELMVGSRALRRRLPESGWERNTYAYPLTLPAVTALLDHLKGQGQRQVILFGEVYGAGVQSFDYGVRGGLGFRAFDLLVEGRYLDYADFSALCRLFGVEVAPILGEVEFCLDTVRALSAGPSTVGGTHIREGVVVKPAVERAHPKVGRVIMKYVSDDYLFGSLNGKQTDFTEE